MPFKLNPLIGNFDLSNAVNTTIPIPEYSVDPSPVNSQTAWVLRQGSGGSIINASYSGTPMGLLIALTYAKTTTITGLAYTYQFSYRTDEGTTIRSTLS